MVASISPTATASAAPSSAAAGNSALSKATSAADQSQNFLKLLVAQLNNQDPMNPMDNAQMTSQIAQINTVSGIQQLNTTMGSLAGQYTSMQVMQGAGMIGHNVLASGNNMSMISKDGATTGNGALNLAADASNVTVTVTSPGGKQLDSFQLGAMGAGDHNFTWPNAASYTGGGTPTFSISAVQGGSEVAATPMISGTITSVGTDSSGAMNLTLQGGSSIAYSAIKAIQ
jgi:flagellar basal-body rod modification protein FlgD